MAKYSSYLTPEGVIAFPHLAEPSELGGKLSYSFLLLLEPGDPGLKELKRIVKTSMVEAKLDKFDPADLSLPFQKGEEKKNKETGEIYEGFEGKIVVKFRSKNPVSCFDIRKRKPLEPAEIYSGCIVIARFFPQAFRKAGNQGIALRPLAVGLVKAGEPLGMGPMDGFSAFEEVFDKYGQEEAGPGPGVSDDDLPF